MHFGLQSAMILAGSLAVTARVHGTVLLGTQQIFRTESSHHRRLLLVALLTAVLAPRFMPALVAVSAALFPNRRSLAALCPSLHASTHPNPHDNPFTTNRRPMSIARHPVLFTTNHLFAYTGGETMFTS